MALHFRTASRPSPHFLNAEAVTSTLRWAQAVPVSANINPTEGNHVEAYSSLKENGHRVSAKFWSSWYGKACSEYASGGGM